MTRIVHVTRAEKEAAAWVVERCRATGRPVPPAAQIIADATMAPSKTKDAPRVRAS